MFSLSIRGAEAESEGFVYFVASAFRAGGAVAVALHCEGVLKIWNQASPEPMPWSLVI